MEPSLGAWVRVRGEAEAKAEGRAQVQAGFRNFVTSIEDFILHFAVRQFLCGPSQRYYITDLTKGAMLVKRAGANRTQRYDRWFPLLVAEVDLVAAPGAHVFAVGDTVDQYLRGRSFTRNLASSIHYSGKVIHYSPLAGQARSAGVRGHEASFELFRGSVSLESVLATARAVLRESVPPRFQADTLTRLSRQRELSESQQKLIFNYKLAFEPARRRGASRG
jgi:hypothetical protein